ncbi:MAG: hypothetical protein ACJAYU_005366 [Bradymonadia bacterium]
MGTNFNDTNLKLIDDLRANGHFVVTCNHGQEHIWPDEMTPAVWPFLSAFRLGDTESPFGDELPPEFPEYCSLP